MASRKGIDEETGNQKGSMWNLDQKLDQPMDEEAMRLKSMSRNKVHLHFAFEGNLAVLYKLYSCPSDFVIVLFVGALIT